MYNGISEEIRFSTEDYKEGYIKGVEDSQSKKEEIKEVMDNSKSQDEFDKLVDTYLGNFYFNFYKRFAHKLKPMNYVRFLYLCSYMDYENRLVKKNGNKNVSIYEKELQSILNIGKTEYYNTKKELVENDLIIINEDKSVSINNKYCKKGKIIKNSMVVKIRMFNNGIRILYENCNPKEHKKLAFLFDIIKYCHYDYNIICHNPHETLEDKIIPINVKELCVLLGYKNVTDFKRKINTLKIDNKPVFDIHSINNKQVIQVNPQVYYNGNKLEHLKGLLVIFGICTE